MNELAQQISARLKIQPTDTLTLRLAERKINPLVIDSFDIKPMGQGWAYRTPRGAVRWKNQDSKADNKYAWISKEQDSLLYRFDIAEAIQAFDYSVWLVTEFDVFALHSAGVPNVVGQLTSESSVPDELPAFLQSLGVLVCYIAPDKDKAGQRWAQRVTDKLKPAGVDVVIRDLPDTLGEGADIGKAWQAYTGRRAFLSWLLDLPSRRLETTKPTQQPKPEIKKKNNNSEIIQQIIQTLGVYSFNAKGYSVKANGKALKIHCPHPERHKHGDKTPSAGLHREFGVHCFSCGAWYGWRDIAQTLGIDWKGNFTQPTPAPEREMLSEETISGLIAAGYSVLAHAVTVMYAAGWAGGEAYHLSQLAKLINRKRAYKAYEQMQGRGADKRKGNTRPSKNPTAKQIPMDELSPRIIPFFSLCNLRVNSGTKIPEGQETKEKKEKKGRPSKAFRLAKSAELAGLFGNLAHHYSEIPDKKNLADWRAEVQAARIDREPGQYSRKALRAPLKISTSTTRTYNKRAGVNERRNYDRVIITSADLIPEDVKGYLENDRGDKFQASPTGYEYAIRKGGNIYLVKYLANTYWRKELPAEEAKQTALDELERDILETEEMYNNLRNQLREVFGD